MSPTARPTDWLPLLPRLLGHGLGLRLPKKRVQAARVVADLRNPSLSLPYPSRFNLEHRLDCSFTNLPNLTMSKSPPRAKSSQPNIPADSNPIGTKSKCKRGISSVDEAKEEVRQPNNPADLSIPVKLGIGRSNWH